MVRNALIACLVLFAVPAWSTDARMSPELRKACRQMVEYQPSADVEYKPGTDEYGLPVTPADVPETAHMKMPETVDVAITFDQARQLGLPTGAFTPNTYLGNVSVTKNGDVYYNGKRISATQQQALCKGLK